MLIIFGPEADQRKKKEVLKISRTLRSFFIKEIERPGVDRLVIVDDPENDIVGNISFSEVKFSDLKKEIQELVHLVGRALLDLNGKKKIIYPSEIHQEAATTPLGGELGEHLHAILEACREESE